MKKKIISTLLCTAMLATMVAGCGVEKSDGGSDTESSASSVAEMIMRSIFLFMHRITKKLFIRN